MSIGRGSAADFEWKDQHDLRGQQKCDLFAPNLVRMIELCCCHGCDARDRNSTSSVPNQAMQVQFTFKLGRYPSSCAFGLFLSTYSFYLAAQINLSL